MGEVLMKQHEIRYLLLVNQIKHFIRHFNQSKCCFIFKFSGDVMNVIIVFSTINDDTTYLFHFPPIIFLKNKNHLLLISIYINTFLNNINFLFLNLITFIFIFNTEIECYIFSNTIFIIFFIFGNIFNIIFILSFHFCIFH